MARNRAESKLCGPIEFLPELKTMPAQLAQISHGNLAFLFREEENCRSLNSEISQNILNSIRLNTPFV